jgi:tetratricopeptide (TPR) repeat protein
MLALAGLFAQGADPLSKAEELYGRADYQASLRLVREDGQASAQALGLIGRDHFMLGDYKKAAEAFERAFRMEPGNSEYAHWLGRSFGRRAETAAPFFTGRYASKAREYFEKAVALDGGNEAALRDLFEYYLEAPGCLGGGFDKAEAIARQIGERNPGQGLVGQAKLANRRHEFDTVDEQLRRVVDMARHGRIAASLAPNSPQVIFARARLYMEQKRNDRARALLNEYLRSNLTPGDPLRVEAQKLLKEASGA